MKYLHPHRCKHIKSNITQLLDLNIHQSLISISVNINHIHIYHPFFFIGNVSFNDLDFEHGHAISVNEDLLPTLVIHHTKVQPSCPIFTPTINKYFNSEDDDDYDYDPFASKYFIFYLSTIMCSSLNFGLFFLPIS